MRQVFVFGHDGANFFGTETRESDTRNLGLRLPESGPRRRRRRSRRKRLLRRQRRVLRPEADVGVTVDGRRRRSGSRRLPVLLRRRRSVVLVVVVEEVTRRDAQGPEKFGNCRVGR